MFIGFLNTFSMKIIYKSNLSLWKRQRVLEQGVWNGSSFHCFGHEPNKKYDQTYSKVKPLLHQYWWRMLETKCVDSFLISESAETVITLDMEQNKGKKCKIGFQRLPIISHFNFYLDSNCFFFLSNDFKAHFQICF